MTASYNISFLGSPEQAEGSAGRKDYRSCKYNNAGERKQSSSLGLPSVSIKGEANNYIVEVVDFDNESRTFEVDARSEAEASEQAVAMAEADGVMVSYCNVYRYIDSF